MELIDFFEVGDYVEIEDRNGERARGAIIGVGSGSLIVRSDQGMKIFFNTEHIVSISQIEAPGGENEAPVKAEASEAGDASVAAPGEPDLPQKAPEAPAAVGVAVPHAEELSLYEEYRALLSKTKALTIPPELTMETVRKHKFSDGAVQSKFQSICSSIDYALKKDPTSLDDKVNTAIQTARRLYQQYDDDDILRFSAFFSTLFSPRKKADISHFCDAVNGLLKNDRQQLAVEFLLSNGRLPDALGLWKQFISAPQYLVAIFRKDYDRNANHNQTLLEHVNEIQQSVIHDCKSKNLLLYALLASITKDDEIVLSEQEDAAVLEEIVRRISGSLSSFSDKGVVVDAAGGSGTVLTRELSVIPYENADKLSVGDAVELWWDGAGKKASIKALMNTETERRNNLNLAYQWLCTHPASTPELAEIKEKLRIRLYHARPSAAPAAPTARNTPKNSTQALIRRQTSAKTAEEIGKVVIEAREFLKENPTNKTAVSILIELLMRKVDPHYEEAISVFEQYQGLFENSLDEKIKNYRRIFDAFFAICDYERAKDILLFVIRNSQTSPADYYIKLAQCYLQLQKYDDALDWCEKTEKTEGSAFPSVQTPLRTCKFAAYIGLGRLDDAKRELELFENLTTNADKIAEMRNILDGFLRGQSNIEDILDDIILIATVDNQFLLSELYTPYLKQQLDDCDFSQIRDRIQDEQTGRWTWRPSTAKNAEDIFNNITKNAKYHHRDSNEIRIGVLDEVAVKYLNMSKIAEVCLKEAEKGELDLSVADTAKWKSYFVLTSARYMWLLYKKNSVRESFLQDSCAFFLKECIGLYLKDHDNAQLKSDYYDALNAFLMITAECEGKPVEVYPDLRTKNIEQLGDIRDNPMIAEAQDIVIENLQNAFATNPKGVMKGLASIISQYPSFSGAAISLLTMAGIEEGAAKCLSEILDFNSEENELAGFLESLLLRYAEELTKNFNIISTAISEIEKEIRKGSVSSLETNAERILTYSAQSERTRLSKEDVARCGEFTRLVVGQDQDSFCQLVNENIYDFCNRIYTSINNACANSIRYYRENPTELSFAYFVRIYAVLAEASQRIKDDVAERSLPVLSFSDDYVDEGYTPDNDTIKVMLRVANGRKGENCTTATNICLDVRPGEGEADKCNLRITHYENVIPRLPKGEEIPIEIEVPLTREGARPDSVITLSFLVTYQMINGKKGTVQHDQEIYIKGRDFEEIRNPYGVTELTPGGKNRDLFVGRDNDIDNLSNEIINGGGGKTIIIYGQFRSGKSSLGKFLAAKVQERDSRFILADAGTVFTHDGLTDIVKNIVIAIMRAIKKKYGGTLPAVLEEFDKADPSSSDVIRYFTDFAQSLNEALNEDLKGLRILVLLDELGRFLVDNEASVFTELWKSVMTYGAFDAILIGHDSITSAIQKNTNAFGVAKLFQISYLTYEPTVRLITDPTAMDVNGEKRCRFIGKSIDYIWSQSGGHVFYIQHICSAAVAFMNNRRRNVINETYLQQAIREYINTMSPGDITLLGHPLFQSSEGKDGIPDDDNKIVLDAITKTASQKPGSTFDSIIRYINDTYQDRALPQDRIENTLISLLYRKVITRDGGGLYSIVVKFYSDYLNDHIMSTILPSRP